MIGVLFATQKEAAPFLAQLNSKTVQVSISGMGMEAAGRATEALIEQGATTILNAGVCGALTHSLQRGSVHFIASVCLESGKKISLPSSDGLRLLSVDQPLFEPKRRKHYSKEADLVDMEGFAVAHICREKKIPALLIKGVTDFGDAKGRRDIQTHLKSVSESVAQVLLNEIKKQERSLLKKVLSFTKMEHTLFSLPLLFAGAWLGAGGQCPTGFALGSIALVGLGARMFGMALNRLFDRKIDAKNPRTKNRELPSGTLRIWQGYSIAGFGLILYFLGCGLLGSLVLKLSLLPLIPLAIYSLLKRFTPLCHYGIGIALAAAPLGAFVAVSNSTDFTPAVLWFALFTFCWISGFDIIYALLDLEFDRNHHLKSLPASLGFRGALWMAAATHLLAIFALLMLVNGWVSALFAGISTLAFIAGYLPQIPISLRFFPISIIAGIAGAFVVLFA